MLVDNARPRRVSCRVEDDRAFLPKGAGSHDATLARMVRSEQGPETPVFGTFALGPAPPGWVRSHTLASAAAGSQTHQARHDHQRLCGNDRVESRCHQVVTSSVAHRGGLPPALPDDDQPNERRGDQPVLSARDGSGKSAAECWPGAPEESG